MQMERFGWITTSCKHAIGFWCTMELLWQLRSENVKAVSKKKPKYQMSRDDEEKLRARELSLHPMDESRISLHFYNTYNIFGPRFMCRNLMNVTIRGLFLFPFMTVFMRRELTRRGLRNGETSRTSWPQRDERMLIPGRVQVVGFCLLWKMAVTEKRNGAGYLVLKAMVSVAKPSYKSSFLIKRAQATY